MSDLCGFICSMLQMSETAMCSLELGLWGLVSHNVDAGNKTQIVPEDSKDSPSV